MDPSPDERRWIVDVRGCDAGEFGYIPTHVVALRVEPSTLQRWIEYPEGIRIVAGAGDPLPVQLVARDIGVGEQRREMSGTTAPVLIEILRQERSCAPDCA